MTKRRVDSLDLVRIGLIFTVFLCHTAYFLPNRMNNFFGSLTGYALELFFIVSGFLSALNYFERTELKTKDFLFKKLKKVYPLHLITYLLCLFLTLQTGGAGDYKLLIKTSVANLSLLQSWIPKEDYIFSFNGVTWFLSVLMFCYLMTPVTLKFIKKIKNQAIWLLLCVIAVRFIYFAYYKHYIGVMNIYYTNVLPAYRFLEYFSGMLFGVIYMEYGKEKKSSFIQLFGLVAFFLAFQINRIEFGRYDAIFIFFEFFLLYSVTFADGIITTVSKIKIVKHLSYISFTFYMLHQVVVKYTSWITGLLSIDMSSHKVVFWCLELIVTLGLCELYHFVSDRVFSKRRIK